MAWRIIVQVVKINGIKMGVEKEMLSDSETYPTCIQNFMKIDRVVSEAFDYKNRDMKLLYIRRYTWL